MNYTRQLGIKTQKNAPLPNSGHIHGARTLHALQPGVDVATLERLRELNSCKKKGGWNRYVAGLQDLFSISNPAPPTKERKIFLAGFIVGEGSLNVSAKKVESGRFGLMIDPEFSISQHVNGVSHLLVACRVFQTGTVRYKSGSNGTMVFRIDNRESLRNKVLPYCEQYCQPYASDEWKKRLCQFTRCLQLFKEGAHLNARELKEKILPIWDEMRKQRTQKNSSLPSLLAAQQHVDEFISGKG